jgi:hypothetical protein
MTGKSYYQIEDIFGKESELYPFFERKVLIEVKYDVESAMKRPQAGERNVVDPVRLRQITAFAARHIARPRSSGNQAVSFNGRYDTSETDCVTVFGSLIMLLHVREGDQRSCAFAHGAFL